MHLNSNSPSRDTRNDWIHYNPYAYNALIGDITEKTLFSSLSDQFGIPYMSPVDPAAPIEWPVKGVVFGPNKRVFVNLVVTSGTRSANVFFLVSTTSPLTFVSPAVAEVLEPHNRIGFFYGKIHGEQLLNIPKSPQNTHFGGLNLLGDDFFRNTKGKLLVDYPSQPCSIFKTIPMDTTTGRPHLPHTITLPAHGPFHTVDPTRKVEAQTVPQSAILELLESVRPLLPMAPDDLARDSLGNIRDNVGRMLTRRQLFFEQLIAKEPQKVEEAEEIRVENIKLAQVHQQLKEYA